MVFFPGFQLAGHTKKTHANFFLNIYFPKTHPLNQIQPSPCLSVNWNACSSLKVSSTDLPTGKSLTVIWRKFPLSSMRKRPLKAMPSSSLSTPYRLEMSWVLSAKSGMFILPKPPCLRGVLTQAKWLNSLSVETATSSQPKVLNSSARSEKLIISVGQTKVLETKEM